VARIFAVLGLAVAAVVVIVVVSSSLGGSDETSKGNPHAGGQNQQKEQHAKYYVVQPGDTFAGIAEKEGYTVPHLEELNPNLDTQLLPEKGCINLVPEGCKILANGG
jgi:LysM repeat protein